MANEVAIASANAFVAILAATNIVLRVFTLCLIAHAAFAYEAVVGVVSARLGSGVEGGCEGGCRGW